MNPPTVRSSLRGLSLTEMMVALSLVGITAAVALPRVQRLFDHTSVKNARTTVVSRFNIARLAATQGSRTAVFNVSAQKVWVVARPRVIALPGSTVDTLGGITDLGSEYGVGVSYSLDSVVFDPRGLGGSTGTITLSRGSATDSVVITAFGKVSR